MTLQEWSLGGPVLKLWIVCRSEIQDGRHDSTYFNIGPWGISHFHLFFWNHKTDLNQTWQKCSLDGHIQDFCFWRWSDPTWLNVFWLVEILKIFLLETTKPIELWLCRNDGRQWLDFDFNIGLYGNFTFSSFFLKPHNRFESNLAEMFIVWSYTRFLFLVQIGNPTWLPGPIMCSDWSKF